MKVLVACEFSGVVREAFRQKGHLAYSCDLRPAIDGSEFHFNCDVKQVLCAPWDLIIAHPPCTYLANSGVQYIKTEGRYELMLAAREFFMLFFNAPHRRICIENPVPHSYANLPPYDQIIQPYYFGDTVQKRTCLWLKNLKKLKPTNVVDKGEGYIGKNGRSNGSKWYQLQTTKDRTLRSITFPGIAKAMAERWG